jgi:hypothetical protein
MSTFPEDHKLHGNTESEIRMIARAAIAGMAAGLESNADPDTMLTMEAIQHAFKSMKDEIREHEDKIEELSGMLVVAMHKAAAKDGES